MKHYSLLSLTLLLICFSLDAQAPRVASDLKFNKDGKFKILQLTDTHVIAGDSLSERTLKNLNSVLDSEKPDFVIHTGNIV